MYTARYSIVKGVENVGKRTLSDPKETGCRGKRPSDIAAYSERSGKYRQTDSIGSEGDGLP